MTERETSIRILIISGSVGAGHDGAADELSGRLRARGVHVDQRDYLDALPVWARVTLRDGYQGSVLHIPDFFEWLFISIERSGIVQLGSLLFCRIANRKVLRWSKDNYDLIVSTYPLASQSLGQLRAGGHLPSIPLATYLTDPAPHWLWVHPEIDHHLTVTAATAEEGWRVYGQPMRPVGPLVPARFRETISSQQRAQLRAELGVTDDTPIALLAAGSLGLGNVEEAAAMVAASGQAVPVVLCGHNHKVRRRLRQQGIRAEGWRTDVHQLLHAVDLLVHNAGGLSFTEAMVAGVPAVSYACLPGHGIANAAVLESSGLAPWARTPADLATALKVALTPPEPAVVEVRRSIDADPTDAVIEIAQRARVEHMTVQGASAPVRTSTSAPPGSGRRVPLLRWQRQAASAASPQHTQRRLPTVLVRLQRKLRQLPTFAKRRASREW